MKTLQYQQDTIKQNLTVIGVDLSSIQEKQQLLQEQQKQLQMNESFLHQLQSHSISLTTLQVLTQEEFSFIDNPSKSILSKDIQFLTDFNSRTPYNSNYSHSISISISI